MCEHERTASEKNREMNFLACFLHWSWYLVDHVIITWFHLAAQRDKLLFLRMHLFSCVLVFILCALHNQYIYIYFIRTSVVFFCFVCLFVCLFLNLKKKTCKCTVYFCCEFFIFLPQNAFDSIDYGSYISPGASAMQLQILNQIQRRIFNIIGHVLATLLQWHSYCRNLDSLSPLL